MASPSEDARLSGGEGGIGGLGEKKDRFAVTAMADESGHGGDLEPEGGL
jgi:hypothetical protein